MTMKDQIEQLKQTLPTLAVVRAIPSLRGSGVMDVSLMAAAESAESAADGAQPITSTSQVRQALADAGLIADSTTIFPGAAGAETHTFIVRGLRPDPKSEKANTKPAPAAKG